MEYLDRDSSGRPKKHRLLLSLDEFPTLGRLDFFTMNLRQMAGYGIKAHLIVQSFNDIIEQYGVNNTILDNCHILSTFAAADTITCQRISQMVGTVTEYRESYSEHGRNIGVRNVSHSEHVRPLLSPGDIRELSVDDQLMFVTGYKPMRVKKVRYYNDPTFTKRLLSAPDQSAHLNVPAKPRIDWLPERPKGARLAAPGAESTGLLSEVRPPAVSGDEVDREVPDKRSEGEYG
jgi:type IV secretion system protein VirD4